MDIELIASSLPHTDKMQCYLLQCDQEDYRVDILLKKILRPQYNFISDWPSEKIDTEHNWRLYERELRLLTAVK